MKVLFFFIDGVGLGKEVPANPFVFTATPGLNNILGGGDLTVERSGYTGPAATLTDLDSSLGLPGLPQSATGQTTIFTGVNAPAYLGRHASGFPGPGLRKLLACRGIFKKLKEKGYRVCFANAYRPPFFDQLRHGLKGERYSCSTLITYYGEVLFLSLEDINQGRALFMDITNDTLQRLGYNVDLISPETGAERLLQISTNYDFTLFEYFISDLAGHTRDRKESSRVISVLDRFIGTLAELNDHEKQLIIISSDHGNLEDLTTGAHTCNPVPGLLIGPADLRGYLAPSLGNLTDLLPVFRKALEWKDD